MLLLLFGFCFAVEGLLDFPVEGQALFTLVAALEIRGVRPVAVRSDDQFPPGIDENALAENSLRRIRVVVQGPPLIAVAVPG